MSAPELHSGLALRCTPALGVEGAKVYLQVKEHQILPPDSERSQTDSSEPQPAREMLQANATFTKSPPETTGSGEAGLKQGSLPGRPAAPPPQRPAGKGGVPRARGRVKSQGQAVVVEKSTAGISAARTVSNTGASRRLVKKTRGGGGGGGKAAGKRELQKLLQTRKQHLFLSRKYGALWGRKVFGRVLPSVARRHHHRRLKRRSFGVWCRQWWTARREWKLNIRADCHNRYRVWIQVWKHWTEFMRLRKERKVAKLSAISHNERRFLKRAWSGWCEYRRERKKRHEWRDAARQWHLARTLRSGWMRWRESLQLSRGRSLMLATAVHHWTTRQQTQVWVCWVGRYRERAALREGMAVAEQHWVARWEAACWAAWTAYVVQRRKKRHMNELAVGRWTRCVLRSWFSLWLQALARGRELADFQQLVEERGRRAAKRRALAQWRHHMELVFYEEHLMHMATSHHCTTLKSRAVVCLRRYCERQQLQKRRKSAAVNFRHLKVLESSWRQWLQRCEHCEEIKILPLTRKARLHFRCCALRRFFPAWKTFVVLRQRRKAQITLADQHFKSTALPKCFAVLRDYLVFRRYRRELLLHAESFRRENLLSMVFYQWWRAFHVSRDLHAMERVAVLHCEEMVKRVSLRRWRVQTRLRVRQLSLEHSAVVYQQRQLLSAALNRWRDCRRRRVVSTQKHTLAKTHHTHRSMSQVWTAWREYVERQRERKARCARGRTHYHTALLQRTLSGWQIHHCDAVRKKEKRIGAEKFHSVLLERHALRQWRETVEWCKLQRHLDWKALAHCERTTHRKCFTRWRARTVQSLETAQRERERVQHITAALTRGKLVRALASWREFTCSSVTRRIGNERAVLHSRRRLLQGCLAAWHTHHRLSLRKMLLARQCAHFLRSRLLSTFYAKWRVELMRAVVVRKKSVLALWHWGQSLQRKALVCWLMYAMNRKRKAERYAAALRRHRSRLLLIGVTQWIEFATGVQARRTDSALQHQTQVTEKVVQCVRRCARRWREAARRGGQRRHQETQLTASKTQTRAKPDTQTPAGEDIWTSIARKHQISGVPVHQRPQPRRPHYRQSLARDSPPVVTDSDLVPRQNVPRTPTPPLLYGQPPHQRVGERDSGGSVVTAPSFTFLPSTVSELSSAPVQRSTSQCRAFQLPATGPHSGSVGKPLHHPVLLPPSAFDRQPPANNGGTAHRGQPALSSQRGAGGGLGDPAVRSQIVRVRDEMRRYHQMRVRQKTLEQQVACAGESGSPQLVAELQAELSRTVEELHRTEPLVLELAAKVQHHISQNIT